MRIIAGKYGSRPIKTIASDSTRPTLDKVKESVFSRIGPYFDGGMVLDLFAGSGAIGLECVSRGMTNAYMVEKNNAACMIIQENVKTLKAENCMVWKMDYLAALKKSEAEGLRFDFIYIDPPYRSGYYEKALGYINDHKIANMDADVIVESLKEEVFPVYEHLKIIKEAIYGITKITYMRYKE